MDYPIYNPGQKVWVNGEEGHVSQTGQVVNQNGTVIGEVKAGPFGNRIEERGPFAAYCEQLRT